MVLTVIAMPKLSRRRRWEARMKIGLMSHQELRCTEPDIAIVSREHEGTLCQLGRK